MNDNKIFKQKPSLHFVKRISLAGILAVSLAGCSSERVLTSSEGQRVVQEIREAYGSRDSLRMHGEVIESVFYKNGLVIRPEHTMITFTRRESPTEYFLNVQPTSPNLPFRSVSFSNGEIKEYRTGECGFEESTSVASSARGTDRTEFGNEVGCYYGSLLNTWVGKVSEDGLEVTPSVLNQVERAQLEGRTVERTIEGKKVYDISTEYEVSWGRITQRFVIDQRSGLIERWETSQFQSDGVSTRDGKSLAPGTIKRSRRFYYD